MRKYVLPSWATYGSFTKNVQKIITKFSTGFHKGNKRRRSIGKAADIVQHYKTISLDVFTHVISLVCNNSSFFYFFLCRDFQDVKSFLEIIFVLQIQKTYLWNKTRIYFSFPLFRQLDLGGLVDAFELPKHRVTSHLLNESRFPTCCTTQNQNIFRNGTVVRAGLRIRHAKIARSSSMNP